MITLDGYPINVSGTAVTVLMLIAIFVYAIPTIYNFWILFNNNN